MTQNEPLIDFKELNSNIPGERLEEFTRQIGRRTGLSSIWSGRGPDGGRDLIFTEALAGPLTQKKIRWLVSCKDKAISGDSVYEKDLPQPGIKDKLSQHDAEGFLLVTTTTVSASVKELLDSLDIRNGGDIYTLVWDQSELTAMLLEPEKKDLLKQFFPKSYQKVEGLTTLEGAIMAFHDQIPEEVFYKIMRLVKPYLKVELKGEVIWPYDSKSAETIDNIIISLLYNNDVNASVDATSQIEYDAFIALVDYLKKYYQEECYKYLFEIVCCHSEQDLRFNAAQILFDNYELQNCEVIEIAIHLDSNALEELYSDEITYFVLEELYTNTVNYDLYSSLDILSSLTRIEEINISDIFVNAVPNNKKICFSGTMTIDVSLEYDRDCAGSRSFPGTFSGHFDKFGIYLEEATVDTSKFYE